MTIKTYRTRALKGYSIHVFIEGDKRTPIVFKGGCTVGSTATYATSNEKIQNALESLGSFGVTFYLDKVEKIGEDKPVVETPVVAPEPEQTPEEEKEVVSVLDAQTFKNLVELRNALKDKGIDVSSVTNVKAAENIAKKNGYNYTVEKNA